MNDEYLEPIVAENRQSATFKSLEQKLNDYARWRGELSPTLHQSP